MEEDKDKDVDKDMDKDIEFWDPKVASSVNIAETR